MGNKTEESVFCLSDTQFYSHSLTLTLTMSLYQLFPDIRQKFKKEKETIKASIE